ncbi:MAG: biopolymer transporter ExbD [Nannocystaceae bacterium]|nr:biopolymer transporter ExbD [Nannocystaceae bacterium]
MGMDVGVGGKVKVKPDMNVTPLVDVVLVLLIIFMVLAPVMTEAFNVRLPPKDDKDEQLDQVNDADKPLVLSVGDDGSVEVNTVALDRAELPERLRRMFNARPDNVLYLDGGDEAPYGAVLGAVDLARQGGAAPVVMITKKLE